MVKQRYYLSLVVAVALVVLCASFAWGAVTANAAGDNVLSGGDGTYAVKANYDLKMGADNFTDNVTVEKQGANYYLTVGYSSSISYLRLDFVDKAVGTTTEKRDSWTYNTFTVSEQNLSGKLPFVSYIGAMARQVSFGATLDLTLATKTADTVRDLGERPAEFVPTIATDAASEYSLSVGTTFPLPSATATLGGEQCDVTTAVTYNDQTVEVAEGKLTLANVGEYKVVYRATSSAYKTSLGNDTFAEYEVVVHSVAGDGGIVRLGKHDGALGDNVGIVAGKVGEGSSLYDAAKAAIGGIADNFEVFTVELFTEDGDAAMADGAFELLFRADDYFDRTKAEVYLMDADGNLTKLSASGYGRYVSVTTDKVGTFVVCVPGVAFHMPMWGYALILVGALLVVAAVVVAIVIAVKRGKKAQVKQ